MPSREHFPDFSGISGIWHGFCKELGMPPRGVEQRDHRRARLSTVTTINQSLLAAVGAIILTATSVGAAVGPARAVETAPAGLATAPVSGQAQA